MFWLSFYHLNKGLILIYVTFIKLYEVYFAVFNSLCYFLLWVDIGDALSEIYLFLSFHLLFFYCSMWYVGRSYSYVHTDMTTVLFKVPSFMMFSIPSWKTWLLSQLNSPSVFLGCTHTWITVLKFYVFRFRLFISLCNYWSVNSNLYNYRKRAIKYCVDLFSYFDILSYLVKLLTTKSCDTGYRYLTYRTRTMCTT